MSALKIIELRRDNVLHLNLEEFKKITTREDLVDRSLVVLSIAGAMRKGKSFLLNFLLTYAYNEYSTTKTIPGPKKFKNSTLIDGFSHQGGTERHTTGIQVWPDIFLHDYPDGKKIAIIFMDTQGTFDYETKFCDCVSIFALSTLLSSVQIYNINHNIQNDYLQYLALFVEYAKLALDQIISTTNDTTRFDSLQILVRDWNFPLDAEYGLNGGKKILAKTFSSSNIEVQKTVSTIKDAFKTIECFLMPFPGEAIASTPRFDGTIENVDKTFLENVALLIAHLLSPENLQIKKIDGVELKVGNFVDLIERGFNILSKYENIPKPQTIVGATAESQSFKLISDALDVYKKSMSSHFIGKKYLENAEFIKLHTKYLNESMKFYENADKVETFDAETEVKWKTHLENLLIRESNYFLFWNEKNEPNTSEPLKMLINAMAQQKDMIQQLNDKHAQDMLDLINTFRQREAEHREHIHELTSQVEQSPSAGLAGIDMFMKLLDILPSQISTIAKTALTVASHVVSAFGR